MRSSLRSATVGVAFQPGSANCAIGNPHHHLILTSSSPHPHRILTSSSPHHHLILTSSSPHPHLILTSSSLITAGPRSPNRPLLVIYGSILTDFLRPQSPAESRSMRRVLLSQMRSPQCLVRYSTFNWNVPPFSITQIPQTFR